MQLALSNQIVLTAVEESARLLDGNETFMADSSSVLFQIDPANC